MTGFGSLKPPRAHSGNTPVTTVLRHTLVPGRADDAPPASGRTATTATTATAAATRPARAAPPTRRPRRARVRTRSASLGSCPQIAQLHDLRARPQLAEQQ